MIRSPDFVGKSSEFLIQTFFGVEEIQKKDAILAALKVIASKGDTSRLSVSEATGVVEALISVLARSDRHVTDAEKLLLVLINSSEYALRIDATREKVFKLGKNIITKELASREGTRLIRLIEIVRALTLAEETFASFGSRLLDILGCCNDSVLEEVLVNTFLSLSRSEVVSKKVLRSAVLSLRKYLEGNAVTIRNESDTMREEPDAPSSRKLSQLVQYRISEPMSPLKKANSSPILHRIPQRGDMGQSPPAQLGPSSRQQSIRPGPAPGPRRRPTSGGNLQPRVPDLDSVFQQATMELDKEILEEENELKLENQKSLLHYETMKKWKEELMYVEEESEPPQETAHRQDPRPVVARFAADNVLRHHGSTPPQVNPNQGAFMESDGRPIARVQSDRALFGAPVRAELNTNTTHVQQLQPQQQIQPVIIPILSEDAQASEEATPIQPAVQPVPLGGRGRGGPLNGGGRGGMRLQGPGFAGRGRGRGGQGPIASSGPRTPNPMASSGPGVQQIQLVEQRAQATEEWQPEPEQIQEEPQLSQQPILPQAGTKLPVGVFGPRRGRGRGNPLRDALGRGQGRVQPEGQRREGQEPSEGQERGGRGRAIQVGQGRGQDTAPVDAQNAGRGQSRGPGLQGEGRGHDAGEGQPAQGGRGQVPLYLPLQGMPRGGGVLRGRGGPGTPRPQSMPAQKIGQEEYNYDLVISQEAGAGSGANTGPASGGASAGPCVMGRGVGRGRGRSGVRPRSTIENSDSSLFEVQDSQAEDPASLFSKVQLMSTRFSTTNTTKSKANQSPPPQRLDPRGAHSNVNSPNIHKRAASVRVMVSPRRDDEAMPKTYGGTAEITNDEIDSLANSARNATSAPLIAPPPVAENNEIDDALLPTNPNTLAFLIKTIEEKQKENSSIYTEMIDMVLGLPVVFLPTPNHQLWYSHPSVTSTEKPPTTTTTVAGSSAPGLSKMAQEDCDDGQQQRQEQEAPQQQQIDNADAQREFARQIQNQAGKFHMYTKKELVIRNGVAAPNDFTNAVGVSDAVSLSMLFSGNFSTAFLKKFSEDQIYYYSTFFFHYRAGNRKEIFSALLDKVNSNRQCALHMFFLNLASSQKGENSLVAPWKETPHIKKTIEWMDLQLRVGSGKKRLKSGTQFNYLHLVDPLGCMTEPVTGLTVEKIFSSNAKPMLLSLHRNPNASATTNSDDATYNAKESPLTVHCIFKRGDDLRQDYAVQALFFLFNRLWEQSGLNCPPFIHLYKNSTLGRIVPMGPRIGVMEFVKNCTTSGRYNWKNLDSTVKTATSLSAEEKIVFLRSMAGSYVGAWVLGIRDRHQDNMMVKDNKIFFHIDFAFILNDAPGFDAPIFSIPREVKKYLTPREWTFFVALCGEAVIVLRENAGIIVSACTSLFYDLPDISALQIRKYLVNSLLVGEDNSKARARIYQLVEEGCSSTQKEMKYMIHGLAQKMAK